MSPETSRLILHRLDAQDEVLSEIKTHTAETNGRVRKLELWQAQVLGAKAAVSWIPPAVTAMAAAVVGAVAAHYFGI